MGEAVGSGGSDNRRLLIMASVVVVVSAIFMLGFLRGCAPKDPFSGYTVIYSNLDLKDAADVVTQLKVLKIPYQIRDDGRSIAVAKPRADEARLGLAEKNLPTGGSVGWEIFDTSKLGTTDFDRRVQFVRAISGELARTIMRIEAVQDARVQIVIPQTTLFEVTKVPVTASVLLQLRTGRRLSKEQVNGIVRLVASSVENLRPENVTIVDVYGNILSGEEGIIASQQVQGQQPSVQVTQEAAVPAITKEAKEVSKKLEVRKETILPKVTTYEAAPTTTPTVAAAASREVQIVPVGKQLPLTPEEKALQKLKAKEEMENRMSSRAQVLVNRFFPPNSILVKVSLELDVYKVHQKLKPCRKNITKSKKKAAHPKPAGHNGQAKEKIKIKRMTVIVLVDNRFNMTKALKKTAVETITGALSCKPKRGDKIIIRQVPFHYATAYQSGIVQKPPSFMGSRRPLFGSHIDIFKDKGIIFWASAAFIAVVFLFLRRRRGQGRKEKAVSQKPVQPEGEQGQRPSAVDNMRSAVAHSPEKVASLLSKWLTEEEGST